MSFQRALSVTLRGITLSIFMPSVAMLTGLILIIIPPIVVRLIVILLSVVAPDKNLRLQEG